jgi:Fic family protein
MNPMQSSAGRTRQVPEGYLAFFPDPLPPHPELVLDDEGVLALTKAEFELGRLAQMAKSIPNPDLFAGMYVRREAILSSEIENISCTLDEVLEFEAGSDRGQSKAVAKVVKYVRAFHAGLERIGQTAKIDSVLLRDLHGILLQGEEEGNPGSLRPRQNWIGRAGSSAAEADFVPPPEQEMYQALGNLEYFINKHQSAMAPLVRCALAHAQFETIHPFTDGNGRIGRLLIALILCRMKKLEQPLLYISLYLLENRPEYYDRLTAIRARGDWLGWIKFLLLGIELTAKEAIGVSEKLLGLQADMNKHVQGQRGGPELIDLLYEHPIIDARGVRKHLDVTLDTAIARLQKLEKLGIVREITGQKRGRVYRFDRYIDTLDDGWSERKAALERNRKGAADAVNRSAVAP